MDNVLVTGGAGYIGSHACKALRAAGFNPVTFDSLVTGWEDAVKFGPFERGDLLDRARLDEVFAAYRPVAVMHFAALSQVGESMQEPGKYWLNNAGGSLNLIEATAAAGCKHFVFSSTCATYGDQDNVVLDEESVQQPINAYGASKRAVENILYDFERRFGLRHVIFRYFNVAGCDPLQRTGQSTRGATHLIKLACEAALGKRPFLGVFGTDYDTDDGSCVRDFIHVSDLVNAHYAALNFLRQGGLKFTANCGYSKGYSVLEVIDAVKRVSGNDFPVRMEPRRAGALHWVFAARDVDLSRAECRGHYQSERSRDPQPRNPEIRLLAALS